MTEYQPPPEEIKALIKEILSKSPDEMAYHASAIRQFYYIMDCHRVIKALMAGMQ